VVISLSNHVNAKTRSKKMESFRILTNEEIGQILGIQECALSINLIKMKLVKLTQTRPTPFQNGILTNSCSIGSKKDI
jgi:hypothetical protein